MPDPRLLRSKTACLMNDAEPATSSTPLCTLVSSVERKQGLLFNVRHVIHYIIYWPSLLVLNDMRRTTSYDEAKCRLELVQSKASGTELLKLSGSTQRQGHPVGTTIQTVA